MEGQVRAHSQGSGQSGGHLAFGRCLQFDQPMPLQTELRITYPKGELMGKVRYCVYREIGYFLGVEFEPGCKWSARHFKPQHLLDPRRLVIRSVNRASKLAN